jgi:predicted kinase
MPVVHLIHGFLGSGKTTFALRLEQETGALRFSPDERMTQLHGDDPPAEHFNNYLAAIMTQLSAEWTRAVQSDRDVILDYGFWTRTERDAARQTATSLGATVRLYTLHCPEATARRRIRLRNTNLQGSLIVTDATYDFLRPRFEPLQPDEPHLVIESAS